MAESKADKKTIVQSDSFADDLDAMFSQDMGDEQQVGLIDDEDAIDRLLVDNAFQTASEGGDDMLSDIDRLLDGETVPSETPPPDFDEFGDDPDDLLASLQAQAAKQSGDTDIVSAAEVETPIIEDEFGSDLPDLAVAQIDQSDEFGEESIDDFAEALLAANAAELVTEQPAEQLASIGNSDVLAELDEFSDIQDHGDVVEDEDEDDGDFLTAAFDISSDDGDELIDNIIQQAASTPSSDEESIPEPEHEAEGEDDVEIGDILVEGSSDGLEVEPEPELAEPVDEQPEPELVEEAEPVAETPPAVETVVVADPQHAAQLAEHAAMLAGLGAKLDDMHKQQARLQHTLLEKPDKQEVSDCLEQLESLQTDQRKVKRNLDAVADKKPVAAYVASGLAVVALIVGGSLGYQGYVAKSQVKQLIEIMSQFQAKINEIPAADAAEKESVRKQLDEISRVASGNSARLDELGAMLQGDGAVGGDMGKKLAELSSQNLQMGTAIESLQAKVDALTKGSSSPKPAAKKTEPVQENWVVNLIAFKQDWYAKRKAEEYAAKGIPAKVVKADSKGETWYRLAVDGFGSQYEAAAYAAKVKKTLNLDSVWLNKQK